MVDPDTSRAGSQPHLPLVGRDAELAVLRAALAQIARGRGQCVLISGEPGIGKTALIEALLDLAAETHARTGTGTCYDLTDTSPYYPWIECLTTLAGAADRAYGVLWRGEGDSGTTPPSAAVLFARVLTFLTTQAAEQPLVLFLDDLHWADDASMQLLRFVARQIATLPILLVTTYRSTDLDKQHAFSRHLPYLLREVRPIIIDLHGLTMPAIHQFVSRRYALADADASRLGAYLYERTEGNPLYMRELLATLEEHDVLSMSAEGWQLADNMAVPIPSLLPHLINQRVARLGEAIRHALTVAAVIGHEVPIDLWAVAMDLPEEIILTAVEAAVGERLMEVPADGMRAVFTHELIRETLYHELIPPRRRHWHLRIAAILGQQDCPDPEVMAHHLAQVRDPRAALWLQKAGERAQRSYAWDTAIARYIAALALLESSGAEATQRGWLMYRTASLYRFNDRAASMAMLERASQLATAAGDPVLEAYVRFSRGMLQAAQGAIARGLGDMEAGMAQIDPLAVAGQTPENPLDVRNAAVGWGLIAAYYAYAGRFTEARTCAERVLPEQVDAANGEHEPRGRAEAASALAVMAAFAGQPDEARQYFERARHVYQELGFPLQTGLQWALELHHVALAYAADDVIERHRIAAAAEHYWMRVAQVHDQLPTHIAHLPLDILEGRWDIADADLSQPNLLLLATHSVPFRCQLAFARGAFAHAWSIVQMELPQGADTPPGDRPFASTVALQRLAVQLALAEADLATARAWLEAHDRWLVWSGVILGQSERAGLWAQYYRASGDGLRAVIHAEQSLAYATEPRQPLALLAAHRLLGLLHKEAGRLPAAATHLTTSLALAERCVAPYERACTLLVVAERHIELRDWAQAASALADVYAICTPLRAKPVLSRVATLSRRIPAGHRAAGITFYGLSDREIEVLRLLAKGWTSRQIAEALSLSHHTVNTHLSRIYAKLDVTSRSGATRFAIEHHLDTDA